LIQFQKLKVGILLFLEKLFENFDG